MQMPSDFANSYTEVAGMCEHPLAIFPPALTHRNSFIMLEGIVHQPPLFKAELLALYKALYSRMYAVGFLLPFCTTLVSVQGRGVWSVQAPFLRECSD